MARRNIALLIATCVMLSGAAAQAQTPSASTIRLAQSPATPTPPSPPVPPAPPGAPAPAIPAAPSPNAVPSAPAQTGIPAPGGAPMAAPSAAAQAAAADTAIGSVATLQGSAAVTRNNATNILTLQDPIYKGDVLQTGADGTLGITFDDDTTFTLTPNSRITVDEFVYQQGGAHNASLFSVVRGTVAFVAAQVAKTGDMKIATPTASLGIRGTTGLIVVPEGATPGTTGEVSIKLYPDADGRVGHIDVNDRVSGQRLGSLTQGSSGFAVRPGIGGARATAAPLTISPQESARDQGIVRQVHATQSVGRQIVTEQRAIRRANPPAANQNRGNQSCDRQSFQNPHRRKRQPQQRAYQRDTCDIQEDETCRRQILGHQHRGYLQRRKKIELRRAAIESQDVPEQRVA